MSTRWPPRITSGGAGGVVPPVGGDHFAPEIIVGNIPAGDPAFANPAPFQYLGDTGNGAMIAVAFAAAAITGGWVHIRRGLYDFGAVGAPALPLTIDGFRVTGDGTSTVIRMNTLERRLFIMETGGPAGINGAAPELADIGIDWTVAAVGASGAVVIDAFGGAVTSRRALLSGVSIIKNLGGGAAIAVLNANETVTSVIRTGFATRILDCHLFNLDGTVGLTVVAFRLTGFGSVCATSRVSGTNVSYRVESGGGMIQQCIGGGGSIFASHTAVIMAAGSGGSQLIGNSLSGDECIVLLSGGGATTIGNQIGFAIGDGIRIEAGATDALVTGNRMNGFPLVTAEATAEVAHNTL